MVTPYVYDIEVYPNCFVAVFLNLRTQEHKVFGFWEDIDDKQALADFLLNTDQVFIGYNNINFDGVILQTIIEDVNITHEELTELRDACITSRRPLIPEWKRSFVEYDVFRIWHYNNKARSTSLKHLEHVYRLKSIKDLPYHYNSKINSQTAYDNVVQYCKYDLVPTLMHYKNSIQRIKGRHLVMNKFGLNVRNASDSSMGEKIILYNIAQEKKCRISDLKSLYTDYNEIAIREIPLDIWKKRGGICEKVIKEHFNPIVLKAHKDPETGKKLIPLKGNKYTFEWQEMEITIGFGGIHGCVEKGVYTDSKDVIIKSSDVTSQYPNAVINFNIYPEHLGKEFVSIFRDKVYRERGKYPKKTHFAMNQTYKLACNAAVGKFADRHSPLFDVKCNLRVTVNCQLAILALAEDIVKYVPKAKLLMLNTDGLEVAIPRDQEHMWSKVCARWERITKFQLEHEEYSKMVINNVNNYLAVNVSGQVKRKGLFRVYEDFINTDSYHNDPSATIIPAALNEYFVNGTAIEDTVNNCEDINEFTFGVKKTRAFTYAVIIPLPDRRIKIKKFSERVFRYYVSNSPKSGNLVKNWHDGRTTQVNKDDLIMPALTLRSQKASKYPDLDRDYYINKAHEIRSEIEY